MKDCFIDGRRIGAGATPYIIAEMSGNHNGDINRALELIKAAKDSGADAVKLQTYTADTITLNHGGEEFMAQAGIWKGRRLYDLYQEAATPWEWHQQLFSEAKAIGITIFSSPFDHTAVDFLEELDVPAYKIASFELVDIPLIKRVARTGKPIIMSTGNACLAEIEEAVQAAKEEGAEQIILLHCTSGYPTPPEEANIATIPVLKEIFQCPIGLSDHTMDIGVSIAAVAMGASVIEKHFTLSRSDGGPDSSFSLESGELKALVRNVKLAFESMGKPTFSSMPSELKGKRNRRSLYVVSDIRAGDQFTEKNVRSVRPGYGLKPKYYAEIIGKVATKDLLFGTPLKMSDIHW